MKPDHGDDRAEALTARLWPKKPNTAKNASLCPSASLAYVPVMAGSDLILGHLRAIRSDIGSVKSDLRDIKARMASIESYQVAGHGDAVRQSSRLDEIEARIEQVERRLELRDG